MSEDEGSPEWWRRSLSADHDAARCRKFQMQTLDRMSTRQLTRWPRDLERIKSWVKETREVSLKEILKEAPSSYGGVEVPWTASFRFNMDEVSKTAAEKEAKAVYSNIRCVIRTRCGFEQFGEYLRESLCAENILFFQVVEELDETDPSELPEEMLRIVDTYVKPNSDGMVNVQGSLNTDIVTTAASLRLANPPSEATINRLWALLKQAQEQVLTLMEFDLMPKFLASESSKVWCDLCRRAVILVHEEQMDPKTLGPRKAHSLFAFRPRSKSPDA